MRALRRITLLVVATAWATTASGHPFGSGLTVAAYRGKANAICTRERTQTMSSYTHSNTLPQYLNAEVPIVSTAFSALKRLEPPAQLASLHAQILATVKSELSLFTFFQQEALAGMLTVAQWQSDPRPRQLSDRELLLWKKAGASVCAR